MDELISLRLPSELLEKVDAEAEANNRSRAFTVREALKKAFADNGKAKPAKKPVKKAGSR